MIHYKYSKTIKFFLSGAKNSNQCEKAHRSFKNIHLHNAKHKIWYMKSNPATQLDGISSKSMHLKYGTICQESNKPTRKF